MDKKLYRIRNWKDYNRALEQRGSITIWFDEKAREKWIAKPEGKKGRPVWYSETAILSTMAIRYIFHLPLRQTEGLMKDLAQMLGIAIDVPDYTTMCIRQRGLKIDLPRKRSRLYLVVDSSGLKIFGEGEWKVRIHGYSKRRTWRKLHIGVGPDRHIEIAKLTGPEASDSRMFEELLKEVPGKTKYAIADGAYDYKSCYRAAVEQKVRLITPPRKGSKILRLEGMRAPPIAMRNKHVQIVHEQGLKAWKIKTKYHRRSLVENAFFRLKTIFGERLASRLAENQRAEALIKCMLLNKMSQVGMPKSVAVI
jgi:hypothetical protein